MIIGFQIDEGTPSITERGEGTTLEFMIAAILATNDFDLSRLSEGATIRPFQTDDGSEGYIIYLPNGSEIRIQYGR